MAATLETNSEHPIARGIVKSAADRHINLLPTEKFHAIPGKGIEAVVAGRNLKVVSPGYLKENHIEIIGSTDRNHHPAG